MMNFMSEGFQAFQLSIDEIHMGFHRYDKRLNGLTSMVIALDTCHLASYQRQDQIL